MNAFLRGMVEGALLFAGLFALFNGQYFSGTYFTGLAIVSMVWSVGGRS